MTVQILKENCDWCVCNFVILLYSEVLQCLENILVSVVETCLKKLNGWSFSNICLCDVVISRTNCM